MPLDHYVTLGHSGLRVSPLCLGAMTFGEDLGWGASVETSGAMIGRYVEQFEDNIRALDLQLTPEQTSTLDELTAPKLPFPLEFLRMAPAIHQAGTTVNGEPSELFPYSPRDQSDHY
jgi:aryl-alcohol dehydrogenase-like predicted oxidoreductase